MFILVVRGEVSEPQRPIGPGPRRPGDPRSGRAAANTLTMCKCVEQSTSVWDLDLYVHAVRMREVLGSVLWPSDRSDLNRI